MTSELDVAMAEGCARTELADGTPGATRDWGAAAARVGGLGTGLRRGAVALIAAVGGGYRLRVLGGLMLLVVVPLVGCSSTGEPDDGTTSSPAPTSVFPTPSATPADPVEAAREAALVAYEGMWAAYDQAGRAPASNPDDPRLADYATGDALDGLRTALGRLRDEGLVFEGSYVLLDPAVVELSPATSPTTAKVEDCLDETGWEVVRADGGEYEDEPGGRRAVSADVERGDDGMWRVTGFALREVGTC